ncbi:hypothetical protein P167DRAFT_553111 [Morchella conica CCBAS932]|uniref:Uncharacterized protein n=2 Tax=Morchella sect. Distantes TaxID=1051054 RepID=A0A3N4KYE1_9PEZI|nr:hypothetical protein P167DRAFT_553111 [Morchella conica CCBAS932]
MTIQITEGSPVHDSGAYYHAGRGGAGNYRRLTSSFYSSTPPATTIPTTTPATTPHTQVFFGGRGGAGNIKPKTERAMFSFDEELERDRLFHQHHAPVYSIGRGGAGNVVPAHSNTVSTEPDSPRSSTSSTCSIRSAPRFSTSSIRSGADKVWDTLTRVNSRS